MNSRRPVAAICRNAVLGVLVALLVATVIGTPSPRPRPVHLLPVAAAEDTTDYVAELRRYFNIDTAAASDAELQALLGPYSDLGDLLRFYVQIARYGEHVLEPTDVSAQVAQLMADYLNDLVTAPFDRAIDDIIDLLEDAHFAGAVGTVAFRTKNGLDALASLVGPLKQIHEITGLYLQVVGDRRFRELLVEYKDQREQGEDQAGARSAMEEIFPSDWLDYVARLLATDQDGLFTRLEMSYDATLYTSDPDHIDAVYAYVTGVVALRRFYLTGGQGQDHGLVVVPGSRTSSGSVTSVTLINDGPAQVDGVQISRADGVALLPATAALEPGQRREYALMPGRSLGEGTAVDLHAGGMWLRADLSAVLADVWLGGPVASRSAGNSWSLSVPPPAAPTGQSATVTWNLGDGTSDTGTAITHPYACAGTYSATATAISQTLRSLQRAIQVTVPDPYGTFWKTTTGETRVAAQVPLTMTAGGGVPTDGSVTATWSFGDGSTAEGLQATHFWTANGNYRVTLSVRAAGSTCAPSTYSSYITVGRSDEWVNLPSTVTGTLSLSSGVAGYIIPPTGTTIVAGAELRLGPGVAVKGWSTGGFFSTSSTLVVNGSLVASGTAAAPVVLTSGWDDEVNGDALHDGASRGPVAGDWAGIVYGQTPASRVQLDHVRLRYAGTALTGYGVSSSLTLTNCAIERVATGVVHAQVDGSSFRVQASTVSASSTGIDLTVSAGAAPPVVRGSTITDAAYGISVTGADGAVLDGLTFTGVGTEVSESSGATRTVVRNTRVTDGAGFIRAVGNLPVGTTRWDGDLPYVLDAYSNAMTVPVGAELRLGPGVVVKGWSTGGFFSTSSRLLVKGSLVATGTDSAPVVLTSVFDDSVGGNVTGYGERAPAIGDWAGIVYGQTAGSRVQLDRVQVRWAGTALAGSGAGSSLSLTNSVVEKASTGVSHQQVAGSSFLIEDSSVRASGTGVDLTVASGVAPPVVRGSTITDATYGISVTGADGAVLDGLTFTGVGTEVSESSGAMRSVVRNTRVTDGAGFIRATGNFPVGTTRWDGDLPYVLDAYSSVGTIPVGAELRLGPGVVVKGWSTGGFFSTSSRFLVNGSLVAEGTDDHPVVLTSAYDATAGGSTPGYGTRAPAVGDWAGIVYGQVAGSRVQLDRVQVRWAGTALAGSGAGSSLSLTNSVVEKVSTGVSHQQVAGSSFLIENSSVRDAATGVDMTVATGGAAPVVRSSTFAGTGVRVAGSGSALLLHNGFTGTGVAVTAVGAVLVDARDNWWGSSSGPAPAGQGRGTSGHVDASTWCLDAACRTTNANKPPVVELRGPSDAVEGRRYRYEFTTVDDGKDPLVLVAASCGQTALVPTTAFDAVTGAGALECEFPDGPAESTVSVLVRDAGGAVSQAATVAVQVANAAPVVSLAGAAQVTEGESQRYSFTVADPGADVVAVAAEGCGDGGVLSDAVFDVASGAGSFVCAFPDGPAGSDVSVAVTDSDGAVDSASVAVQVANAAPVVSLAGAAQVTEGESQRYSFTVADPGADVVAVAAEGCGDGGVLSDAVFDVASGAGSFVCAFPDGPAGSDVSVAVTDSDGAVDSASVAVQVANAAPVVSLAGAAQVTEGESQRYSFTVADPGADVLAVAAEGCGDGGVLSDAVFDAASGAGSFVCAFPDGPAGSDVSVAVTDSDGAVDSASVAVQVANAAPVVTGTVPPSTLVWTPVKVQAAIADPGTDGHAAVVDWGDNSAPMQQAVAGPVAAEHVYGVPGTYAVVVTVTDEDGAASSMSSTLVVRSPDAAASSLAAQLSGMPDPTGALARSVAALRGNGQGNANNGAVSQLSAGRLVPGMNGLLDAAVQLEKAAGTGLADQRSALAVIARSVSSGAIVAAQADAGCQSSTAVTCSRAEQAMFQKAAADVAAGNAAATRGDVVAAVRAYRSALTGVGK